MVSMFTQHGTRTDVINKGGSNLRTDVSDEHGGKLPPCSGLTLGGACEKIDVSLGNYYHRNHRSRDPRAICPRVRYEGNLPVIYRRVPQLRSLSGNLSQGRSSGKLPDLDHERIPDPSLNLGEGPARPRQRVLQDGRCGKLSHLATGTNIASPGNFPVLTQAPNLIMSRRQGETDCSAILERLELMGLEPKLEG